MSDLFTGERRIKTDDAFQALGDLDELNASLGVAKHQMSPDLTSQHEQVYTADLAGTLTLSIWLSYS